MKFNLYIHKNKLKYENKIFILKNVLYEKKLWNRFIKNCFND